MNKYFAIFKISFQQEFAYRLNFVMWRVRNVMQILLVFFLWDTVFANPDRQLFGYDRSKILTYVFGIIIMRAFVMSARAVDVAGEVASGDLANYLLKPINYFKYWLTRDLSSKALNLGFASVEITILYILLKPPFFFQTNPVLLFSFVVSVIIAILIFFAILLTTSAVPFWKPEIGWGAQFLIVGIVIEFLSGALYPLDIFPELIQKILYATPFPYLIFFPLQIYLGKLSSLELIRGLAISLTWLVISWALMQYVWQRGLSIFRAEGR